MTVRANARTVCDPFAEPCYFLAPKMEENRVKTKVQTTTPGVGTKKVRRTTVVLMLALGLFASIIAGSTGADAAAKPPFKITEPGGPGSSPGVTSTADQAAAQLKTSQFYVDYYQAQKADITTQLNQKYPKLPVLNNTCVGYSGYYTYSEYWGLWTIDVAALDSCRIHDMILFMGGGHGPARALRHHLRSDRDRYSVGGRR